MFKRLLFFIALLAAPALAQTYGQRIGAATLDSGGFVKVISGAQINVCSQWSQSGSNYNCTQSASIFQDCAGVVPITQPLTADAHGNYSWCAAAPGFYLEQVSSPGRGNVLTQVVYLSAGGATVTVCGTSNDVQINATPPGTLGCDSGVFAENPTTHTLTVGGSTAGGINTNELDLIAGTARTFPGAGYVGLAAPTGANLRLVFPGAPGSDDEVLTQVSHSGTTSTLGWRSAGGQVSLEYLWPLDYTNAPSPTTSSDLIRTFFAQQGSENFMTPPLFSNPLSALVQSNACGQNVVGDITCALPNPVIPGDAIYVVGDVIEGLGTFADLTFADVVTNPLGSFSNTYTLINVNRGPGPIASDAWAYPAVGGYTTVTMTVSNPGTGDNASTNLMIVELRGVNAIDVNASSSVTWSTGGTPTNLQAVTTTNAHDLIISSAQILTNPAMALTAGSGFGILDQIATQAGTITGYDQLAVEASGKLTTGTYTPTITGSLTPGVDGASLTTAFKWVGDLNTGTPYFRYPRLDDQVTQGWFPDPTGQSGKCLSTSGTLVNGSLNWVACGTGTVTTVSGTTSQIDVATGTTTPVISLDGQFTSVNYATCANTADVITVTLAPAPTSLVTGLTVQCKVSGANTTTTPTLNVNALGAHTIVKGGNSGQAALAANDLLTNMVARFTYDAGTTTWELQNPQQLASGAGTVTSIATTLPITGGTITTTGTIACATCVVASSPGAGIAHFAGSTQTVTSSAVVGSDMANNTVTATQLAAQYPKLRCESGYGDGLNAISAATYLQTFCYNDSGVTWTITGIKCYTDNSGSSTLAATNGAGTALLTGAVTCTTGFAAGTQSATTTIVNGDFIKFTFVADGTSKQTTWVVSMTQ